MNYCGRTLVTLACVAGLSKESWCADIDDVVRVVDAHGRALQCGECDATADVLKSVIRFDAAIKPAIEQISREYVKTLGRCSE